MNNVARNIVFHMKGSADESQAFTHSENRRLPVHSKWDYIFKIRTGNVNVPSYPSPLFWIDSEHCKYYLQLDPYVIIHKTILSIANITSTGYFSWIGHLWPKNIYTLFLVVLLTQYNAGYFHLLHASVCFNLSRVRSAVKGGRRNAMDAPHLAVIKYHMAARPWGLIIYPLFSEDDNEYSTLHQCLIPVLNQYVPLLAPAIGPCSSPKDE